MTKLDDIENWLMGGEGDFTPPYVTPAKRRETSKEAYESLESREYYIRRIIALYETGDYTREEAIEAINPTRYNTVSPRLWELTSTGFLLPTGEYRKTARKKRSEVLRMVPGTTYEIFLPALKNFQRAEKKRAAWEKAVHEALVRCSWHQTVENEATVRKLMLAAKEIFPDPSKEH